MWLLIHIYEWSYSMSYFLAIVQNGKRFNRDLRKTNAIRSYGNLKNNHIGEI